MRVALIHDYLNQFGGAEQVLLALCELFPDAPIYTLLYDERGTNGAFKGRDIRTSILQKIPFAKRWYRGVVAFMPSIVEQFDLKDFDLVLSDSASFAKGVITRPETLHICYCHTPLRYAWTDHSRWREDFPSPSLALAIPIFQNYLRLWDFSAAQRVDHFIANSATVARRIKRYYRRDAHVIHPPVDISIKYQVSSIKPEYYLVVSRLLPYKSVDLAVKAFNELGEPLVIVGDGPDRARLEKMAKRNIKFVGGVKHDKVFAYFAKARALIFPQEEDFGITAVEALSAGVPVIGFGKGGLTEIVKHGEQGLHFSPQTPEALEQVVREFKDENFESAKLTEHAQKFSKERFLEEIKNFIDKKLAEHSNHLTI